jgi:hypothetical protein
VGFLNDIDSLFYMTEDEESFEEDTPDMMVIPGIVDIRRRRGFPEEDNVWKFVQLYMYDTPVLAYGHGSINHAEILRYTLRSEDIEFEEINVGDLYPDWIPALQQEGSYRAVGMGNMRTGDASYGKRLLLFDKSHHYKIGPNTEHARKLEDVSEIKIEIDLNANNLIRRPARFKYEKDLQKKER